LECLAAVSSADEPDQAAGTFSAIETT